MRGKAILLSLLAMLLAAGCIVGTIFLFRVHFMIGIVSIVLLLIPLKIQRIAIDSTNGKLEDLFVKYITPAILLVAIVFIVLTFTLWI